MEKIMEFMRQLSADSGDDPGREEEYFNPNDYAGGNIDDAYELGRSHAEAAIGNTAKALLAEIGQ